MVRDGTGEDEVSGETGGGAVGELAAAKMPLGRTELIEPRMADFCVAALRLAL